MAKAKKKAVQKPKTKFTAEDRSAVAAYINKSRNLVSTVLECGGAFTHDCHEVDNLGRNLGEQLGLKSENWYGPFA
jgi:hypothetical protein